MRYKLPTKMAVVWLLLLACRLGVATATGGSGSEILLSDDFNTENGGFPGVVNYNSFANFDVVDGSVDLIGNGFRDFFPENGLYIDLDGTTRNGADFVSKTTFLLEPGRRYRLSFHLGNPDQRFGGGSTDNEMTVSLGDAYSETFQRSGLVPFEPIDREIIVAAATSAALKFSQAGGDHLGMLIDDVMLAVSVGSADFDGDAAVLGTDFVVWQRAAGRFAGDASVEDGDADGDGFVDDVDLSVWAASYGQAPAASLAAEVPSAYFVPEPATTGALAMSLFYILGWIRKRPAPSEERLGAPLTGMPLPRRPH